MLKSLDDIRETYDKCDVSKCKDCPLNHYVDLIPPEANDGKHIRGTICDVITTMNTYYTSIIRQLLH